MIRRILIAWILLLGPRLFSTHIVGGEIMYKYLSNTSTTVSYQVTMFLYIDCINGSQGAIDIDVNGYLNVYSYNKNFNTYTLYTNNNRYFPLKNSRTGPSRVSDVNYKCIKNKPNACVDKYTFTKDITVPINNDGYTISFEDAAETTLSATSSTLNHLVLLTGPPYLDLETTSSTIALFLNRFLPTSFAPTLH